MRKTPDIFKFPFKKFLDLMETDVLISYVLEHTAMTRCIILSFEKSAFILQVTHVKKCAKSKSDGLIKFPVSMVINNYKSINELFLI